MKHQVGDPAVTKALKELTAGYAVVYRAIQPERPVPTAAAGIHEGQTYFLDGMTPHEVPADAEATISDVGVEIRDREGDLLLYFTDAREAEEIDTGKTISEIDLVRGLIEDQGGIETVLP